MKSLFKKLPIDLGQGEMRHTAFGKKIALGLAEGRGRALDIGCGDGFWSSRLQEKGFEVYGFDKETDANKPLPFADNNFDLVWCSEVIEHLDNPPEVIKEIRRVLKPGGKAILTTPNSYFWLFRIIDPVKNQNPGHKHFFDLDDIKSFQPEEIYGYFPYMILKFRIKRFISLLSPTFIFTIKKS